MNSQFLFFDIDGTLYLPWLGLSKQVHNALVAAKKNGHHLFLCTGRTLIGIPREILSVGFDGIIGGGGASIQIGNRIVSQKAIEYDDLTFLMEQMEQLCIPYELETNRGTYYSKDMIALCEKYKDYKGGNSEMARLTNGKDFSLMKLVSDFQDSPVPVSKTAFLTESADPALQLKKRLPAALKMIIFGTAADGTTNGEIMPEAVDKGVAIREVCRILEHDVTDTVGFGDSFNDLEMLQTCGKSVVMQDADESLRRMADIVCPSIREDGVYHAMKKLNLCE